MNILSTTLKRTMVAGIFLALAFPLTVPAASNNNDAASRQAREQQAQESWRIQSKIEARKSCNKDCSDAMYSDFRGCDKMVGEKRDHCRARAGDDKRACTDRCASKYP